MVQWKESNSRKDKLEEVQRERDNHVFRNLGVKKTSGSSYHIFRELKN